MSMRGFDVTDVLYKALVVGFIIIADFAPQHNSTEKVTCPSGLWYEN